MATLREFEELLRQHNMAGSLALLDQLRERDRKTRKASRGRRVTGKKMTPELARRILDMHERTQMTQQEIAFAVGVNQGRVNEVIKRGKWLSGDPDAPEAKARDRAKARMEGAKPVAKTSRPRGKRMSQTPAGGTTAGQLSLEM